MFNYRSYKEKRKKTFELRIMNLSQEELTFLESALSGHFWVKGRDGNLEFLPSRAGIPVPEQDHELEPFWQDERTRRALQRVQMTPQLAKELTLPGFFFRWSSEFISPATQFFESLGFQQFRTRRNKFQRFWEIWALPNLTYAKGKLLQAISGKTYPEQVETTIKFFSEYRFIGTLDITVERFHRLW